MNRYRMHDGADKRHRITGLGRTASTGIALILTVGAAAGNIYAQASPVDTLRKDVAKLRVEREGMTAETATALPVGWSDTRLYLVTVYHAVAPMQSGGSEHKVTAIRVLWPNNPEAQSARMFERYDPVLDLAVLSIDLPPAFARQAVLSEGGIQASQPVTLIGHPASGDWSVWSGQIQNENSGDDVARFVYIGASAPVDGFSGGPLFGSNSALLGIHSATPTPSYGVGIKTGDIVRLLNAWRVPTNRFRNSAAPANSDAEGGKRSPVVRDLVNWLSEYQISTSNRGSVLVTQFVFTNVRTPFPCTLSFTEIRRGWYQGTSDVEVDLSKSAIVMEAPAGVEDNSDSDSQLPLKILRLFPGTVTLPIRAAEEQQVRQLWLAVARACRQ